MTESTALGDDPTVHRIVDGRFVCTAPATADCRNYPACECYGWDVDVHGHDGSTPQPGHENVPHDECWAIAWMHATDLADCHVGDGLGVVDLTDDEFPDGPVRIIWDGDYLTWDYADDTRALAGASS